MLYLRSAARCLVRRKLVLPCALAAGAVWFSPTQAEAQQLRYDSTSPGGIVATGNTLGLSKQTSANGPGVSDSIGTFISLDPASVDNLPANATNPWPAGTTWDWTANGSKAVLTLPDSASVLYAELVWGGSYAYGSEDVTTHLNDAVTLAAAGQTTSVTPDAVTALTEDGIAGSGFAIRYYLRSANVTQFVKQHGTNTYSVSGVPATQDAAINSLNAAGWTLLVAYRAEFAPIRNLSVFVGGSFVDEDAQVDYTVSGFCAPPTGTVEGSAVVSALEGDANLTGDELLLGQTSAGPFATLSGPNNPATNFFCSQLNGSDGQLDTHGSFGNANQDAAGGANVIGGRQGWDVTTVPLSSAQGHLSNGQTSAVLRTTTTGDSYLPVAVALALDVNAPSFGQGSEFLSDVNSVKAGDQVTLTAKLSNTGLADAEGLTLSMPLDSNLTLLDYTTDGVPGDSTGTPVTAAILQSGAPAGKLTGGQDRVVVMKVQVNGAPSNNSYFPFTAKWGYNYRICANDPAVDESIEMVTLFVTWESDQDAGTGGAGGAGGGGGAGGSAAAGGSAGQGGDGGTAGEAGAAGTAGAAGAEGGAAGMSGGAGMGGTGNNYEPEWSDSGANGGCGCAIPGAASKQGWMVVLAGLAGAAFMLLRGKRRS